MKLIKYNSNFDLPPSGFNNLGFTCYFNSLLQSLLTCTSFVEITSNEENKSELLLLLNNLFTELQKKETLDHIKIQNLSPIIWNKFMNIVQKKFPDFTYFIRGQQCAAEGFTLFLQALEEYKAIQNLFIHKRENRFYCLNCKENYSTVIEENNNFEIDLNNYDNLLKYFLIQKTILDECNCSQCNYKGQVVKVSKLLKVPEILFVVLKRYKFINGHGFKITTPIDFPEIIQFPSYKGKKLLYNITSLIHHTGNLNGGHYYTSCKKNNEWYCLNDSSVSKIEFKIDDSVYIAVYQFIKEI